MAKEKSNIDGQFQIVDWQEQVVKSLQNQAKLSHAQVKQSYSGDIQGKSELFYQLNYGEDGSAVFSGFEYIEATIEGESVNLTLQHNGKFLQGVASSQFIVLACSPFSKLVGRKGQYISGENGQATYQIHE